MDSFKFKKMLILSLMLIVLFILFLTGCENNNDNNKVALVDYGSVSSKFNDSFDEPSLDLTCGYDSDVTEFDIDNVSLNIYCNTRYGGIIFNRLYLYNRFNSDAKYTYNFPYDLETDFSLDKSEITIDRSFHYDVRLRYRKTFQLPSDLFLGENGSIELRINATEIMPEAIVSSWSKFYYVVSNNKVKLYDKRNAEYFELQGYEKPSGGIICY
ncbi:MAG: hypothetical protein LBF12_01010 [Christensenellaceae bacterium]|jgi:uncharacterized lipoprotein NlpE involved in copper resistance|nr:hypothetical protein [Christensenellaceae bacterium]